ncbi:MAG: DUF4124 domain-containing protein [Burkholderiales bacterium]|nr:DUF4124 domain-containing protein [Burkholderiales bacterium]
MRKLFLALLLAFAAAGLRAEIYECVDQNGNKRFTNIKSEARGCKPMNIAPAPSIPSPKPEARRAPAPANFPSVDAQTQKQRDADRRRILEQELANEQKLLDEARKELAEQESIRLGSERNYQRVLDRLEPYKKKVKLHEDNVANLQKELANSR